MSEHKNPDWWKEHTLSPEAEVQEQALLMSMLEKGELKSVPNLQEELDSFRISADNYMKKNARINIRLPLGDIGRIKTIAMQEGLPYQTLVASILHKYLTGRLVDIAHLKYLNPKE